MEKIDALEDAIEKKSLVGIYSVFYTIAHGDPNFSTHKFRDVLSYVKGKNIEGLMQEFDGEEFEPENNWDEEYWALIASSLMDNFCEERIDHLEAVGRKVYPINQVDEFRNVGNVNPEQRISSEMDTMVVDEKKTEGKTHHARHITKEQKRKVKRDHENKFDKSLENFLHKVFRH